MSTYDYKKLARQYTDELSRGNLDVFGTMSTPDFVDHSVPEGMPQTFESTKKMVADLRLALPDVRWKVEDAIQEGDLVTLRVTGSGTMKGPWMGFQPTGRKATWTEIHVMRFRDGKVAEHWWNADLMGMMMQLGLVTMPQMQPATGQPAVRR